MDDLGLFARVTNQAKTLCRSLPRSFGDCLRLPGSRCGSLGNGLKDRGTWAMLEEEPPFPVSSRSPALRFSSRHHMLRTVLAGSLAPLADLEKQK